MRCSDRFEAYRSRISQGKVRFYGRADDTTANIFTSSNFEIYCWAKTYGRLYESYALQVINVQFIFNGIW